MKRRSFVGLAASLALLSKTGRAATDFRSGGLIDAVDLDGAPGLSLAVVSSGRIVEIEGKGQKGLDDPSVPSGDTLFEIGSLTKTFTASLIFELESERQLDADAPVGAYLKDLPQSWRNVTLSMLLSHTSGLPEYLDASNFLALLPQDLKPREILEIAAAKPISFAPGTRRAYNNTGFVLLGMVAEAVAGTPYWDQLDSRFFKPSDMRRTGPRDRLSNVTDVAKGHFWEETNWKKHLPVSAPGATFSAGGLMSTARDLARWSVALDSGKLLGGHARARMWRAAHLKDGTPAGWGFGWVVDQGGGHSVVSHGGGTAGFSCWFRRDLTAQLTTIVLTNQNGRTDPMKMTEQLLAQLGKRWRPE